MAAVKSDADYLDAGDPVDRVLAERLAEIQEERREEARRRAIYPE